LRDQIYSYLSTQVQEGKYKPGNKINELEISKRLDVSRTPVREALTQLSSEGLIVKIPRRGFFVRNYNATDKGEVYTVIACLDELAARLAADRLTGADYLKLEELTEKIDLSIKYRNYDDYVYNQNCFHD
jgi:DNA-binding GntR family transcriptional regulator